MEKSYLRLIAVAINIERIDGVGECYRNYMAKDTKENTA